MLTNDSGVFKRLLNEKINTASTIGCLLPLMSALFPVESLPRLKLFLIGEINNNTNNPSNTGIFRSYYIRSSSIIDILPDELLIKIIQLLDTAEYTRLFCVSKAFNQIAYQKSIFHNYYVEVISTSACKSGLYYHTAV